MHLLSSLALLLALPPLVLSTSTSVSLEIFEKLEAIPEGWYEAGDVPSSYPLRFRIAVKLKNAGSFEQHVIDISTPEHPNFGHHMSKDEVKRVLRPDDEVTTVILKWLRDEDIPDANVENDGDWIKFQVSKSRADEMMNARFRLYVSSVNQGSLIRTLQYSIPDSIAQFIQMIQPTTRFGQIQGEKTNVFTMSEPYDLDQTDMDDHDTEEPAKLNVTFCNTTITPKCLRDLYHIGGGPSYPALGNKLGVCGYLQEYPNYQDLARFLTLYAPEQDRAKNNFTIAAISGGAASHNSPLDDIEANLDVQYAMSLAYLTPTIYFSTGGFGPLVPDLSEPSAPGSNEPYLDFLHYILAQPDHKLPSTLTTSYGEDEQSVPASYTNASVNHCILCWPNLISTCNLFAQLGARGVSVLFSSGDGGVGTFCQTNDGKKKAHFPPTFPGACPFVTSVGGTHHVEPERAAYFSSGGFSDRFPRPAYQNAAVTQFLGHLGGKWKGLFNPQGRAFPDVAAQSYNFTVIDRGRLIRVGGTSASAPTFAAVISLINGARLAGGKKPLGFLNPWLYSKGYKGLNDIVHGGSTGCSGIGGGPLIPHASWNATPGWDPVTGFGTPNFPRLLTLALEEP